MIRHKPWQVFLFEFIGTRYFPNGVGIPCVEFIKRKHTVAVASASRADALDTISDTFEHISDLREIPVTEK